MKKLLALIEAAREAQEDVDVQTDAGAVLMIEVANNLARCEVIVRALVADGSE